jgi:hypothetical protein
MIDITCHRKKFNSAKLKTIFNHTSEKLFCTRSLWYMDIIKHGFNAIKLNRYRLLKVNGVNR